MLARSWPGTAKRGPTTVKAATGRPSSSPDSDCQRRKVRTDQLAAESGLWTYGLVEDAEEVALLGLGAAGAGAVALVAGLLGQPGEGLEVGDLALLAAEAWDATAATAQPRDFHTRDVKESGRIGWDVLESTSYLTRRLPKGGRANGKGDVIVVGEAGGGLEAPEDGPVLGGAPRGLPPARGAWKAILEGHAAGQRGQGTPISKSHWTARHLSDCCLASSASLLQFTQVRAGKDHW